MNIKKTNTFFLEKCYSIAPLSYQGKEHILVAAEKTDRCLLFDLDGNLEETIWDGPGGTMSMVQIPGSDGEFLATQFFYSPNDSKEAKIVRVTPKGRNNWDVKEIAKLPFVHRFDILTRNKVNYIIGCTLKSDHEYKEDWRYPGKIYAAKLPDDLDEISEDNPLKWEVLMDGLLKNHGYCKCEFDDVICAVASAENGVFKLIPPVNEESEWEIETLLGTPVSDMTFVDFNGNGIMEMVTISPFHGDDLTIYQLQDGVYQPIYHHPEKVEFAHALWGGEILDTPTVLLGHRKGRRELLTITCTDPNTMEFQTKVIDSDVGPANVLYYANDGKDCIVSTNRETDEIAFYTAE